MKKGYLLIPVMGMLMAASCAGDQIVELQPDSSSIQFRMAVEHRTKAVSYDNNTLASFNVTAWREDADRTSAQPRISQADFDRCSDDSYCSASKYYWPQNGSLVFYAYAPKAASGNGLVRNSELSYTVTPLLDAGNQIDLVFAKNSGSKDQNGQTGVTLNFRHTMTQIQVKVKNSSADILFKVTGWKIAGVDGNATFVFDDALSSTNAAAHNSENTVERSMWSGNDDSFDSRYTHTFNQINVTGTNSTWGALDGSAILIPQVAPEATAYSGSTPGENPLNGAYIAICYQASDTDGNPVAAVGTWGCWPVRFDWKPGFRYNYTIDLAELGYKEKGTDVLEPILEDMDIAMKFVDVTIDAWQPVDYESANTDISIN